MLVTMVRMMFTTRPLKHVAYSKGFKTFKTSSKPLKQCSIPGQAIIDETSEYACVTDTVSCTDAAHKFAVNGVVSCCNADDGLLIQDGACTCSSDRTGVQLTSSLSKRDVVPEYTCLNTATECAEAAHEFTLNGAVNCCKGQDGLLIQDGTCTCSSDRTGVQMLGSLSKRDVIPDYTCLNTATECTQAEHKFTLNGAVSCCKGNDGLLIQDDTCTCSLDRTGVQMSGGLTKRDAVPEYTCLSTTQECSEAAHKFALNGAVSCCNGEDGLLIQDGTCSCSSDRTGVLIQGN